MAWPPAGSCAFQISFPVSTSNARINGSQVPLMKTKPPAVAMGPPRLIEPGGTGVPGAISPSGTCQRILPVAMSTAARVPHGGGTQGRPEGEKRNWRNIPKGAPRCHPYSPCDVSVLLSESSSILDCEIILTLAGRLFTLTTSRPCCGSNAYPLQFIPPTFPGTVSVPCTLGGVK